MWSSSSRRRAGGLTLIELLVTLVILSILAAAALPYAEITVRREKELELRQGLRLVRSAIDAFHDDWKTGKIPKTSDAASETATPRPCRSWSTAPSAVWPRTPSCATCAASRATRSATARQHQRGQPPATGNRWRHDP